MALEQSVTIVFEPGGEVAEAPPGSSVLAAAVAIGLEIWSPCGGHGTCGQCKVILRNPGASSPLTTAERERLSADEIAQGYRLSCQAQITADATVALPQPELGAAGRILEEGERRSVPRKPNVRRELVRLPPPSLEDQRGDLRRLEAALALGPGSLDSSLEAARELPTVLREHDFQVTATLIGGRLVEVGPPQPSAPCLGMAFDIGTTTVVGYLVDLSTGQELGAASALNAQSYHGEDVISRLDYLRREPRAGAELQADVLGVVNRIIEEACAEAEAAPEHVYEVTMVGNTTMHHLFLGLDASHIAVTPFTPVVTRPLSVPAAELGLRVSVHGQVWWLPNVAGYVGADIVGAMTAVELDARPAPNMLVDIGTNGEVALWTGEELLCCSCAAGPAFEGAQIERGTRAVSGAIERVTSRNGDLEVQTIQGQPPVGICGSGLVDAVAALLDLGLLAESGRLGESGAGDSRSPAAARLKGSGPDTHFVLVEAGSTSDGQPLSLSQADIRQLQLANAAVRTGIEILMGRASVSPGDLREVLLAGAFGSYIRPASAVRIGLLPPLPLERVRPVGNAAGVGAELCLLSTDMRQYAQGLANKATYVELSAAPEFETAYLDAMMLPAAGVGR